VQSSPEISGVARARSDSAHAIIPTRYHAPADAESLVSFDPSWSSTESDSATAAGVSVRPPGGPWATAAPAHHIAITDNLRARIRRFLFGDHDARRARRRSASHFIGYVDRDRVTPRRRSAE